MKPGGKDASSSPLRMIFFHEPAPDISSNRAPLITDIFTLRNAVKFKHHLLDPALDFSFAGKRPFATLGKIPEFPDHQLDRQIAVRVKFDIIADEITDRIGTQEQRLHFFRLLFAPQNLSILTQQFCGPGQREIENAASLRCHENFPELLNSLLCRQRRAFIIDHQQSASPGPLVRLKAQQQPGIADDDDVEFSNNDLYRILSLEFRSQRVVSGERFQLLRPGSLQEVRRDIPTDQEFFAEVATDFKSPGQTVGPQLHAVVAADQLFNHVDQSSLPSPPEFPKESEMYGKYSAPADTAPCIVSGFERHPPSSPSAATR